MESSANTTVAMAVAPTATATEQEVTDLGDVVTLTEGSKKKAGTEDKSSPEALRERMITELNESGVLTDPLIEAAFRAVPREVFAPAGTPAELPYATNDVVETRFTDDGKILSSLSAPVTLLCTIRLERWLLVQRDEGIAVWLRRRLSCAHDRPA